MNEKMFAPDPVEIIQVELRKRKEKQEALAKKRAEIAMRESELEELEKDLTRLKTADEDIESILEDALAHEGDIHSLPFSTRIKFLDKIPDSDHIKKSKRIMSRSRGEVRSAIQEASNRSGSEGAMLKLADFPYNLTGRTNQNIKYKNELSLDAIVLRKNKVAKTEKTFYYHCGLKAPKGYAYCGKTFNTSIVADVGDIIKVVFVDISGYTDPDSKQRWVNWWAPRVIMLREDKKEPDSIDIGWRMVKQTTGRFEEKKMPLLEELPSAQRLERKKFRFVAQHHFRGKSVHVDMRFEMNAHLLGFTLADAFEDKITEPVETVQQAVDMEKRSDIWKVDWFTGAPKKRGEAVEKIWCDRKARQPKGWLDIKGVVPPGEIGATREYPGVFHVIDEGQVEHGAVKPYFVEMFLHGKKLHGRFIFRKLPREEGSKVGKELWYWLYWKPIDQEPYVLSARAIKLGWLPDEGSAMPEAFERRIPPEFQFWKSKGKEALEKRRMAAKYLKEKSMGEKLAAQKYLLTRRHWKGQFVIRGMPVEDWHLRFDQFQFHLDKDPAWKGLGGAINAIQFTDREEFFTPGEKAPKTQANPNLKIPAFVEVIDEGSFDWIEKAPLFLHVRFKAGKLKGRWTFHRNDPKSRQWVCKRE